MHSAVLIASLTETKSHMYTYINTHICIHAHMHLYMYIYKNKRKLENVIISAFTVKDIILCVQIRTGKALHMSCQDTECSSVSLNVDA